ncbi:MAG: pyruvate formate lyase family protein, partial [Candidatus Hydrogenedentes bacterium]|nr:pyruvate formate lyase family protein [Candidatus Hydrogenedentota bacterium]
SYVELVLTNGVSRRDNRTVGVETGDPRQFESFEEVQEAFRKQLAWVTKQCQISGNINERSVLDLFPTTYESALIEGCIEKGMSREEGGAHYNFNTGSYTTGATDAGDSLAAIKRLVFDDKTITMDQLCDALEDDFEGHEDILQMCLDAPKFGNDDDYADEQVSWVHHVWVSECTKIKNSRGGSCSPGGSPMMLYASLGRAVGALPSGRLAGKPLADGHSPSPGNDRNGPTAVLNSVSKVDNVEITGGIILNMRMDPSAFKDGNMARLANLVRAFVDQKIYHMQINIVSSDTLRAAQEEPDKHQDLMVKVAGYNAFFTHLNKTLQNSIIARTEHGL